MHLSKVSEFVPSLLRGSVGCDSNPLPGLRNANREFCWAQTGISSVTCSRSWGCPSLWLWHLSCTGFPRTAFLRWLGRKRRKRNGALRDRERVRKLLTTLCISPHSAAASFLCSWPPGLGWEADKLADQPFNCIKPIKSYQSA